MNNGQAPTNNSQLGLQLAVPNRILTPAQYAQNATQIARAREALATLEEQNQAAYQRYVQQELLNRIEAGRQAEAELARLSAQQHAQSANSRFADMERELSSLRFARLSPAAIQNAGMSFAQATAQMYAPPQAQAGPPLESVYTAELMDSHPSGQQNARQFLQEQYHRQRGHQPQMQQQYAPQAYVPQGPIPYPPMTQAMPSNPSQANGWPYPPPPVNVPASSASSSSAHRPHSSTTMPSHHEQVTSPKVGRPDERDQPPRHTAPPKTQTPAQEVPSDSEITRAKFTYSSQASGSQSSPSAAAAAAASGDRKAVLTAITKDVYTMMKELKPEIRNSVNRLVVDRLKDKLKPQGPVVVDPRALENPQVNTVGTYVIGKVQDLAPAEIVGVLRYVTARLQASVASAPPEGGDGATRQTPIVVDGSSKPTPPATAGPSRATTEPNATSTASPPPHPIQTPQLLSQVPDRRYSTSTGVSVDPHLPPASQMFLSQSRPASRSRPASELLPASLLLPMSHSFPPYYGVNGHVNGRDPAREFSSADAAGRMQSMNLPPTQSEPSSNRSTPHVPRPPDTSTLARDILRSLGKPHRPQDPPDDTKKRKRQSPAPTTDESSEKKQKTNGSVVDDKAMVVGGTENHTPQPPAPNAQVTSLPEAHTNLAQKEAPPPHSPPVPHPETPNPLDAAVQSLVSSPVRKDGAREETIEEIITPGAAETEIANQHEQLVEGMHANIQHVNNVLQQFEYAPELEAVSAATSPPVTATSPPSSQPKVDHGAATVLPSASGDIAAALLQQIPTAQPVPSSSKVPLFLPSSPSDGQSPVRMHDVDADGDTAMDDFVPTGLLGLPRPKPESAKDKGKQRTVEDDDNDIEIIETPPKQSVSRLNKRRRTVDSDDGVVETSDVEEAKALNREKVPRRYRAGVAYVLAPPLPAAAVRINERKEQKLADEEGRRAVYLSRARLSEHYCHWKDCDALLESAEKMALHVQQHASENEEWNSFTCQWDGCGDYYSDKQKLVKHLRKHCSSTVICAYAGCDQSYSTPKDLARHHASEHQDDVLKPTTGLIAPPPTELPPLPELLPSYMTVPRRIAKARMSNDVHVWLGAQIAANITCYVHPGTRTNAVRPSRLTRQLADSISAVERSARMNGADPDNAILRMARDEFDDWIEYGSKPPKFCDDLDSAEVTRMVDEGLVLYPTEEKPIGQDRVIEAGLVPQVVEDANISDDIEVDVVNDGPQTAAQGAHSQADESSFGGFEVHSTASTEEVAEMARMLVDGDLEVSVREEGKEIPASLEDGSSQAHPSRQDDANAAGPSVSDPGWTALAEPDEGPASV